MSYRTGILFAAATIPGALIGSWLTHFIPRQVFGLLFGTLLVLVAAFLSVADSEKDERKKRFHMAYWINLDRAELFFARKVILVEGETEKSGEHLN